MTSVYMDYQSLVEAIADELLTEIVKVSLGHPTSTNIRYGALFGDIIKKARFQGQELGLKAADKLQVYPTGSTGGALKGSYRTKMSGIDIEHPPAIYAALPHKKTGGVEGTEHTIKHEIGHWLNRDVEPEIKYRVRGREEEPVAATPLSPQKKIERETKAIATSREFSREYGLDHDTETDQANLNTYRYNANVKPVNISLETLKKEVERFKIEKDEKGQIQKGNFDIGSKSTAPFSQGGKNDILSRVVSGKSIYSSPATHRVTSTLLKFGHSLDDIKRLSKD